MYKVMKYIYNDLEQALSMSTAFETLFTEEGMYDSHEFVCLKNGSFMLAFNVLVN